MTTALVPIVAATLVLRPATTPEAVTARHALAASILRVSNHVGGAPLNTVAKAQAVLVALAYHESGFDPRVATCARRGLAGEVTSYQLLGSWALGGYTTTEVCASPDLAAQLALAAIGRYLDRCNTLVGALSAYTGRSCKPSKEGKARCRSVKRALAAIDPTATVRCS